MKKFIEALETENWDLIYEGAKKEASRQVGEMTKWMKVKETFDPDGLAVLGLAEPIKKAEKYRYRIYNRNKDVKALTEKITRWNNQYMAGEEIDRDKLVEAVQEKADIEMEQITLAMRVLKIYCHVTSQTVLTFTEDAVEEMYLEKDLYV